MATFKDPLAYTKHMEDLFQKKQWSAKRAHQAVAEAGYEDAIELTSGTETQESLNRDNNPFGYGPVNPRGRKRGRRTLLPVNKQTGGLQSRIRLQKVLPMAPLGSQQFNLTIDPGQSNAVLSPQGTDKMRPRGFWRAIRKRWQQRNLAFQRHYVAGSKP